MAARRELPPRALEARDVMNGGVEPRYIAVLTRLLAAHAMAEKLTALGYERALGGLTDPRLRCTAEQNLAEERRHARLIYHALEELGLSEKSADRLLITALKAPSFQAPRWFADHASGEIDLAMASLSLDTTGLIMIDVNYRESSYAPHSRAAERIIEDEADHEVFAREQLGRVVEKFGPVEVGDALARWLPRAVNFFGPPGSGFTYDCLRYGLKSRDNQELRELFLAMLERQCAQAGIQMPALTSTYPHSLA